MPRIDLDDYELGEQIGAGTVGTIFRVTCKRTGAVRAMKLLAPAVGNSPLVVSRFAREMLILEKLDHPNILAYFGGGEFGGGEHQGQLFFVMELITGGTLKQLLKEGGPLMWREAAESGRQLAAALQHSHNHGIIHRDLKPGNVFVTESGLLKLGDFGIARDTHEQDLTDAGLTVGTYSYMAPELVRGQRELTGQVDLYALGCVLFELMTGCPPYPGDNFAQIFEQHLHSAPPRLSDHGVDCPEELQQLIEHLLDKDPQQRPFNARWVQGYLGDLLDRAERQDAGGEEGTPVERRDSVELTDSDAGVSAEPVTQQALAGTGRVATEATAANTVADTAASSVVPTPAQQELSRRVQQRGTSTPRRVSWAQLGWLLALMLGLILVAVLVSGRS